MNYYNEIDPFATAWLQNLMSAGHIPKGDVDTRSIEDVTPGDLDGYTQCHFFAGIGGWPLALKLAGWPATEPVWTGSCPCQPFSTAGAGTGFTDERHLWPAWFHLIRQRRPNVIFGEQVAGAIKHGWLDLVSADMEAEGYAIGAAVLGAHSVGAPHIRQRLYFVGDPKRDGLQSGRRATTDFADKSSDGTLHWAKSTKIVCKDGKSRTVEPGLEPVANGISSRVGRLRGYGNAIVPQTAAAFIKAYTQA